MDDIIQKLKTPEECMQLAENVKDRNPGLALKARRRAVELRAILYGCTSKVEIELLKALYAYEEVLSEKNKRKTRAARTWQMIKRYGIIGAAERAVNRKIEPAGYKLLVAMGMHDLTFEAIIVRYSDEFNPEVVSRAKSRLKELSEIQPTTEHTKEGKFMEVNESKLWFLRGVLVATCSNRQTITYDEVRRLCRLNDEQLGTYLGKAREILNEGEPDYCAVVVKTSGVPGESWGNPEEGPTEAIKAHQYWQDRRHLDNKDFEKIYGSLPTVPGLASI